MALFKDMAVALRRVDYSETSQVLVVFTREHGKQRLIAKGIKRGTKKRVATGVDLLESGELVWSRREGSDATLGTLTEWRQENAFTGLRSDLARLYGGQYAVEIVSLLTEEGDPHPATYAGLIETLAALCTTNETLDCVVSFQIGLLDEVGLLPSLTECMNCRRPRTGGMGQYLSSGLGGLVCRDCEPAIVEKRRLDEAAIVGLTGGGWTPAGRLGAFDVLDYHIRCIVGRETRLASFVVATSRTQLDPPSTPH